jgi:small subunit ribosomal protein S6
MRKYEIVLVVNQDVPHQGVAVISKKIESLLGEMGSIISSEYWGLRELAYQIGNHKKARYFMLSVEMNPEIVKVILGYIKINESIIRSGIYGVDHFEAASPMLSYTKNLVENIKESDFSALFPNPIIDKDK